MQMCKPEINKNKKYVIAVHEYIVFHLLFTVLHVCNANDLL